MEENALDSFGEVLDSIQAVAPVLSGVLGLATALITMLTALVGRTVNYRTEVERPPLKISLKAILKGWISTLIWNVLLGALFGVVLGFIAANNVEKNQAHEAQQVARDDPAAMPEALPGPNEQPNPADQEQLFEERLKRVEQEYFRMLNTQPPQVAFLILIGLAYVRGSYVAAHTAKTTSLMKLGHGLIAVATFQIVVGLILFYNFPDLLRVANPPLIEKWQWIVTVGACIIGAILGSED